MFPFCGLETNINHQEIEGLLLKYIQAGGRFTYSSTPKSSFLFFLIPKKSK